MYIANPEQSTDKVYHQLLNTPNLYYTLRKWSFQRGTF